MQDTGTRTLSTLKNKCRFIGIKNKRKQPPMVNYGMSASDREHHSLIEPIHYVPPNIQVLYTCTCTCGTVHDSGPKIGFG